MSETGIRPDVGTETGTETDSEVGGDREQFTGTDFERVEDHRILTGRAEYVHDITPENCRHMALLRSMHAHAEIGRAHV